MNKKTICFQATENGFTAIFTTNHGRKILLSMYPKSVYYVVTDCRYIDRTRGAVPKKFASHKVHYEKFLTFLREQLDTQADNLQFIKTPVRTVAELIYEEKAERSFRNLILLRRGDILCTKFKNRFRRTIYLELKCEADKCTVVTCNYADSRDGGKHRIPYSLVNFTLEASLENILAWVNDELEGGFTHILITDEHNIELNRPICGAI